MNNIDRIGGSPNASHGGVRWALCLSVLVLGWAPVFGQSPLPKVTPVGSLADSSEPSPAASSGAAEGLTFDVEARLAAARAQLALIESAGLTRTPAGVSPQDVVARRAGLRRLVRLYEQHLSTASALEKARLRKAETAREAQSWIRFPEPPPYSVLRTDRLREEIQAESGKIRSGEAADSALGHLIAENRSALTQAEEKLRQLAEQLEFANDPLVTARLSWQREQENLRSQLAAVTVALLDQNRLVGQEELAGSRIQLGLLQRQLVLADAGAQFSQADLDKVTGQIERQREQLEQELGENQARQVAALRALEAAREESRGIQGRADASPASSLALELVSVREMQLEAVETATTILRLMLEGVNVERTMWEFRFAAHDSRSVETLRDSERRLASFTRRLDLWQDYARQHLDGSSSQLRLQESRVNDLPPDSALLRLARERVNALRERELILLRFVRALERLERLTQRWAESLRAAEGHLPLTGRVQNLVSDAHLFVSRLWTFEVFTAEDTITVDGQKITGKRSVTIGKITMALLILVVGYWVTGLVTAVLEKIIVKRLEIEPNEANLIRRWLRAFLVVCLLIFSLVSVKIPFTAFAFAGGALAIGLGFGTQNVLKNFVSGLILLFERPFRVGDVLDVGGQKGTVTSVGLRASVLQLWDGTETLIPNSSLLENNVTNWTYSNRKVRFYVTVGVAYGSEPRRVIQLLGEVAERHGLVEKEPKPLVLFTEFGDSTLTFELRFWVDVGSANPAQVSSDLRLMISNSFADHGIVIDFPQRDVHLHAARPIDVRVVSDGDHPPGNDRTPGKAEGGDKPA